MIDEYDKYIQKATENHLPNTDWRLLKAQLQAESSLNPKAQSAAGALGIAQFMPDTWDEVKKAMQFPLWVTPFETEYAIHAAAFYMKKMNQFWTAERPVTDRYCLALASYNAGSGNLLKAQGKANWATDYASIIEKLTEVTGKKNSAETTNYVIRILDTFAQYITGRR